MVLNAPRLVDWVQRQMSVPKTGLWVEVLWKVVVVLAGLVTEWAVRLLLARTRKSVEGQKRDSVWMRAPFLLARTLLDIVPIAAFAGASYVVLPLLTRTKSRVCWRYRW